MQLLPPLPKTVPEPQADETEPELNGAGVGAGAGPGAGTICNAVRCRSKDVREPPSRRLEFFLGGVYERSGYKSSGSARFSMPICISISHSRAAGGADGQTTSTKMYALDKIVKAHCWCSGIMLASHACDPGSIPGQCSAFRFVFCLW